MQRTSMAASRRQISVKLDRVAKLLNEVLEALDSGDSGISPALRRKLVTRWSAIDRGRVKVRHYKSLEAFEKTIG
ncbi:MAG: hypothetical protein KGH58_04420 [Candidatus Micrarchaeota archaeon]|nr:hypothetical protein [Candidatus Micrarchaeota archaeon]